MTQSKIEQLANKNSYPQIYLILQLNSVICWRLILMFQGFRYIW